MVIKDFLESNVPVNKETMSEQQLTDLSENKLTHLRDIKDSLTDIEYKDCINVFNQQVVSNWKDFLVVLLYKDTGIPIIDTNWLNSGYSNAQQYIECASDDGELCPNKTWSAANSNCV